MSRFTPSGILDTVAIDDGDLSFRGVWQKGEPDQIPKGFLRELNNGTCRDGTCRTRGGSLTPGSLQMPAPVAVFGSALFSDPLQSEWLLLAVADGVWRLREGFTPFKIGVPEAITDKVQIVQAFRTVLIFRGANRVPWSWSADTGTGFVPIDQEVGDVTMPIPNGPDRAGLKPVVLQNRLIVPHGRSEIAVSDELEYTRYDATFADFNVTGGLDDTLTALFRYNEGALLVFNTQSVQLLSGIEPTLTALRLDPVNDQIGCIAGGTVARVGNDVFFLADSGIFPVSEVEQRKETAPVPKSDVIDKLMARVNWARAGGAVAAVHGEYYYLALPLDGSVFNNAILPYNSASGAWEGVHTFGFRIDALHLVDWFGRKRLHAVDYATGRVHMLYEGRRDVVAGTATDIAFRAETRAFLLDMPGRKRFRRGKAFVKTWAPRITASLATDGVNESVVLASAQTRDRTRHTVFGKADYDPSNANADHAAPFRQDYSVDTPFNPDGGIDFDLEQHHPIPFTTRSRGRHASFTLSNDQGTVALTALVMEGDAADRGDRPAP